MTAKTKQTLRAISESYVKNQLRHMDAAVPKKDISRAVSKVNDVLLSLEKDRERKPGASGT